MPASTFEADLSAALSPVTVNNTVGLGTFLRITLDYLISLARNAIDTEEERDAIVAAVLLMADRFVKPKFPIGYMLVRGIIADWADEAIDRLPELLGG